MRFKKGHIPWNKGKTGEKSPNYGKHRSEETKRKISEGNKGKVSWIKGKHHSEETRRKLSEAMKGKVPWNTGKHRSIETRRKIGLANLGRPLSEEAKKKLAESHRGRHLPEEHKRKISESLKGHKGYWTGKTFSEETRQKMSESQKGEKNYNWRGGIGPGNYGENWSVQRLRALERDDYACQKCSKTIDEIRIGVHHLIPFRYFKDYEEANRLENLKALCYPCHGEADAMFRREETNRVSVQTIDQ